MLPGGTDVLYRNLLAGAHRPTARLEVWRNGVRIDTYGDAGVPFYDGALTATLSSQVTRQLSFTTLESLWPANDVNGLLAPWGNEIRAYMGIKPGAGVPYEWQVFRGRINEPELGDDSMSIPCVDRAADVKDSGFLGPSISQTTNSIDEEFVRIVKDGVADATFGTFDITHASTPALTWEWDRGSACDDLATASSAYWYALANGDYVLRRIPWTITQTPLLTLRDGDGGTLTAATPRLSRDNVFNAVIVFGERADGDLPVYAIASDNNPTSPTYINGAFGIKTKTINVQAAVNQGQALSLARTGLQQARSLSQSWSVNMIPDPSMELGDCVYIQARGQVPAIQVLSSFSLPLNGSQPMSAQFRALSVGGTS